MYIYHTTNTAQTQLPQVLTQRRLQQSTPPPSAQTRAWVFTHKRSCPSGFAPPFGTPPTRTSSGSSPPTPVHQTTQRRSAGIATKCRFSTPAQQRPRSRAFASAMHYRTPTSTAQSLPFANRPPSAAFVQFQQQQRFLTTLNGLFTLHIRATTVTACAISLLRQTACRLTQRPLRTIFVHGRVILFCLPVTTSPFLFCSVFTCGASKFNKFSKTMYSIPSLL